MRVWRTNEFSAVSGVLVCLTTLILGSLPTLITSMDAADNPHPPDQTAAKLTPVAHPPVEGLYIVSEVISEAEEQALIKSLQTGDGWQTMGRTGRRVLHFGHSYDYSTDTVTVRGTAQQPDRPHLPEYLRMVSERFDSLFRRDSHGYTRVCTGEEQDNIDCPYGARIGDCAHGDGGQETTTKSPYFDQIIVNAYGCRQEQNGIAPHVDRTHCFGPIIVGLSLGDDALLTFQRQLESGYVVTHDVPVHRRSIYVMTGDARYLWRHSIDPEKNIKFHHEQQGRRDSATELEQERISVTWRQVINGKEACLADQTNDTVSRRSPGILFSRIQPDTDATFDGTLAGVVIGKRRTKQRAIEKRISCRVVVGTLQEDPSVGIARLVVNENGDIGKPSTKQSQGARLVLLRDAIDDCLAKSQYTKA